MDNRTELTYAQSNFEQCGAFFLERSLKNKKLKKKDQGLNFIRNASSTQARVTELKVEQINSTG